MNVPFLDLRSQYQKIMPEVEPVVLDILKNCCFIGGKYVEEFEAAMAEYLRVKHVIGCSNGTDALVLGLKACNIKPGDEVITTAFSFFATAEAIASVGAVPVFIDVKQSDYNMDPELIEDAVTEKTRAILPVHIFGAPCDMDRINEIAKKYNLKVIEDDAQAIGCEYKGRKAGTLGDIGCFSFYPTKNLGGAGDGGMVTTNSDDLNTIVRAYREHGAAQGGAKALELLEGVKEEIKIKEEVTDLYNPYKYYNYLIGYNSRLDAIQAAILSVKLKHLSEYKGELCEYLTAHGVGNGTFYPVPLHKQKAFNTYNCKNPGVSLPVAEEIASQTVCLPVFPEMTDEQVRYVIEMVNSFYKEK